MDCDRNKTEEERKWAVKEELEAKTYYVRG